MMKMDLTGTMTVTVAGRLPRWLPMCFATSIHAHVKKPSLWTWAGPTDLVVLSRMWPKYWGVTSNIRLWKMATLSCLDSLSDFLFACFDEGSCWAVSCPMERPLRQEREGGLWPIAHKELNPCEHPCELGKRPWASDENPALPKNLDCSILKPWEEDPVMLCPAYWSTNCEITKNGY